MNKDRSVLVPTGRQRVLGQRGFERIIVSLVLYPIPPSRYECCPRGGVVLRTRRNLNELLSLQRLLSLGARVCMLLSVRTVLMIITLAAYSLLGFTTTATHTQETTWLCPQRGRAFVTTSTYAKVLG